MAEDLVLDTAIRDWVLIPLSVVMVLIGILRYFVSKLMRSFQVPDHKIVKEGQVIVTLLGLGIYELLQISSLRSLFAPVGSISATRFVFHLPLEFLLS
ncbi:ER membrane protein complex subunit 3-like [Hibiscus syriacus]|uniref:ER membrane protein complex subunit 3-like n=1 Tax=Hibiscus syriacus TaxID=106335 RepID=UPI001924C879|nr:ER membrane protein complex subunit 3-like [Hibiscus syriacus]